MSCSSATSTEWPYYYYYQQPYDKNEYAISTNPSSLIKSLNHSKSGKKSRDSRNNPATILKADVANFRALVQQLTGRPTAHTALRARKGPVNISFTKGNDDDNYSLDTDTSCRTMLPFGFHNYEQHVAFKKQDKQVISVDQRMHESVSVTSLSSNNGQTSVASSSSSEVADPDNMYVDLFDDFDLDQCLEDLDWVTSTHNDGNNAWCTHNI